MSGQINKDCKSTWTVFFNVSHDLLVGKNQSRYFQLVHFLIKQNRTEKYWDSHSVMKSIAL